MLGRRPRSCRPCALVDDCRRSVRVLASEPQVPRGALEARTSTGTLAGASPSSSLEPLVLLVSMRRCLASDAGLRGTALSAARSPAIDSSNSASSRPLESLVSPGSPEPLEPLGPREPLESLESLEFWNQTSNNYFTN